MRLVEAERGYEGLPAALDYMGPAHPEGTVWIDVHNSFSVVRQDFRRRDERDVPVTVDLELEPHEWILTDEF